MSDDPNLSESEKPDETPENLEKDFFKEKIPKKLPIVLKTIDPNEKPTGNFYLDLEIFLKQLNLSFEGRYALWDNTSISTMNMLREIRKKNEKNTKSAINTLKEIETKILKGFEQFKLKRDEIERFSGLETRKINQDFKKTLDMLQMQIREYVIQKEMKDLYKIYF